MAPSKASKGVAPDRLKGLLKPLGEAIINRPPYASGTVQLPGSRFSLFYKGAKDGFDAKWLDLASATPEQLEQLTQACQRATFGVKNEDVMDESYRKAGKMDADCFATPLMSDHPDLVKLVRGYFLEEPDSSRKIRIELYKLNVYDKDAFFKAHVDTPRSEKMFGSLVLVFPTPHEGGTLLLRHRGEEWAFNSAAELARAPACSLGYVVLFSDIEHEVTPVTEGYRVTLTYNLYFDDSKNDNRDETDASDETDTSDETSSMSESSSTPASALSSSPSQASANAPVVRQSSGEGKFRAAFEAALANPEFLPKGGTLGFGLRHAYQVEHGLEHVYSLLKGSDGMVYRTARALGFEPTLYLYYQGGGTGHALSEVVVNANQGDLVADFALVVRSEGGILVKDPDEYRYRAGYMDTDEDDDFTNAEEVHWVTPLTRYSREEISFIAYGNEPSLGLGYGDICLIVRIGGADDRMAYKTIAQLQQEWDRDHDAGKHENHGSGWSEG